MLWAPVLATGYRINLRLIACHCRVMFHDSFCRVWFLLQILEMTPEEKQWYEDWMRHSPK